MLDDRGIKDVCSVSIVIHFAPQNLSLHPHIKRNNRTRKTKELKTRSSHVGHFAGIGVDLRKFPAIFLKSMDCNISHTTKKRDIIDLLLFKEFKDSFS